MFDIPTLQSNENFSRHVSAEIDRISHLMDDTVRPADYMEHQMQSSDDIKKQLDELKSFCESQISAMQETNEHFGEQINLVKQSSAEDKVRFLVATAISIIALIVSVTSLVLQFV